MKKIIIAPRWLKGLIHHLLTSFTLFMLLSSSGNAQNKTQKQLIKENFTEEFIHEARHFFDWNDIEHALAVRLGITESECIGFLRYLDKKGKITLLDYLNKVKSGTIQKNNAIQYWLNKLPEYELIYKQESANFAAAKKAGSQPPVPYTGGAICNNLDVSTGNLSGWTGSYNDNGNRDPANNGYGLINNNSLNSSAGINNMSYVHEICTAGNDPDIPSISRVPPGHTYSVRLGSDTADYSYNHQTISNTFMVTPQNCTITYWYAVIFQQTNGNAHLAPDQPFFKIRMFDQNNNEIICAHYDIDATSAAAIGGFQTQLITSGNGNGYQGVYKDWTQVMIPLINYMNQNVTIKFETSDCNAGGHAGYAYLAVDCAPYQVILSTPFLCNGGTATMTAPSGAATYSWAGPGIVSGGSTNQITLNAAGSYTVTMTTIGNSGATCTFTLDTSIIKTLDIPIAGYTNNTPCIGAATNFTDGSSSIAAINSWSWAFGDGATSTSTNPSHTYNAAGNYLATLIVSNAIGCRDTIVQNVAVNPNPTAAFTVPNVCQGTPSSCTNTSTPFGSNYYWTFLPGVTDNATNASYLYAQAGIYPIKLLVKDPNGCKDSVTVQATVLPNPAPAFTIQAVCFNSPSIFVNNTPAAPVIGTWAWDFDNDGIVDNNTQSPIYTYPAPGTYTTTLTASTSTAPACTVTKTVQVVVHPNPVSSFTASTVCLGAPTVFNNTGTTITPPDQIAFYNWTFGDGTNISGQNPSHTYTTCGTFNANLVVVSNNNCTHSSNVSVTVNCNPVPLFTAPTVCQGQASIFTDQSTISSGTISNWCWDLDMNPLTCELPNSPGPLQYVAPTSGSIPVTLTVTSNNGCAKSVTLPVTVNPKPNASFTAPNVCAGRTVTLTNTTPGIQSSEWDFTSDGTKDALTSPATATYPGANTYNITLYTTDQNNCKDTLTQPVNIYPNPIANFTFTDVCFNTATPLSDLSTVAATPGTNTINSWAWDYNNDGVTDTTIKNPSHIFPNYGSTTVSLIVSTNNGCKDTVQLPIFVSPNPVINFTAPAVCLNLPTQFTNNSTVALGSINTWAWDFTNNNSTDNTTQAPNYTYPSAGIFNVKHTATSDKGCTASLIVPVEVYPLPHANFTYSRTCVGNTTTFTNLSTISTGTINVSSWDFDNNGSTDNTTTSPTTTITPAGTHQIHLSVLSDHSCPDDTVIPIYINPKPIPTVAVDDPDGCPVHHANLSGGVAAASVDHPNSIVKWEWDVDGNGTLDITNTYNPGTSTDLVAHDYINNHWDVSEIYTVSLTVTSDSGCVGTYTTPAPFITVFPQPLPGFTWGPQDPLPTIYSPLVNFYNEALGATAVSWNFGDPNVNNPFNNTSTQLNPTHNYESYTAQTYYVTQWVANGFGCKDSIVKPIEILPNWTFYIPNAFTPNDDGVNDGFRGTGININSYNIWIFDRWGNMIFYSKDLDQYWDGRVQGHDEICQQDVYVWKVKFKDLFGQPHQMNGTVTLIK